MGATYSSHQPQRTHAIGSWLITSFHWMTDWFIFLYTHYYIGSSGPSTNSLTASELCDASGDVKIHFSIDRLIRRPSSRGILGGAQQRWRKGRPLSVLTNHENEHPFRDMRDNNFASFCHSSELLHSLVFFLHVESDLGLATTLHVSLANNIRMGSIPRYTSSIDEKEKENNKKIIHAILYGW